jgi:hypothetical protein
MQSLNPTRIVQRRGREVMIIGAFVLIGGLVACACSLPIFLLQIVSSYSNLVGGVIVAIGTIITLGGIGVMARGLTYRTENLPALAVADVLGKELDDRYTLIRNVSRRGLGYIDAVLVGPPGALVFRILDQPGDFSNEGADWLERKGGRTYVLSKLNPTRECVTDIYALRKYLARMGMGEVPVYGVVVFTNSQTQLTSRSSVVPIAALRTLTTVLRRDYLAEDRLDQSMVESTVQAIYT